MRNKLYKFLYEIYNLEDIFFNHILNKDNKLEEFVDTISEPDTNYYDNNLNIYARI